MPAHTASAATTAKYESILRSHILPASGDQHLNAITRNDVKAFARDLTVETLTAQRSRLTIAVDFEGHGIGKLLVPLVVRREARKEMPTNLATLKQRPERR